MPKTYVVQQGDCIASIAYEHGFLPEKLWNHPSNKALKDLRRDPYILKPDDVVTIPDLEVQKLPCATDRRHTFKRRGVPARFKIRLTEDVLNQPTSSPADESQGDADDAVYEDPQIPPRYETRPRANLKYILQIEGQSITGATGQDGSIEQRIPPNARKGTLILEPGTVNESRIDVELGALDPADTVSGAKRRLAKIRAALR